MYHLTRQSIYQPWLMLAHLLMIDIYLLKNAAISLTASFASPLYLIMGCLAIYYIILYHYYY